MVLHAWRFKQRAQSPVVSGVSEFTIQQVSWSGAAPPPPRRRCCPLVAAATAAVRVHWRSTQTPSQRGPRMRQICGMRMTRTDAAIASCVDCRADFFSRGDTQCIFYRDPRILCSTCTHARQFLIGACVRHTLISTCGFCLRLSY